MEGLRRFALAVALATALIGCGRREVMSTDVKPKDPFASLTGEQKVDAIRKDVTIPDMERHAMISDAQKAAGLPVTGQ